MHLSFNFHDIVALEIDADEASAAFFQAEYRPYAGDAGSAGTPRVRLTVRRGTPHTAPAHWTRWTHKILARWAYHIRLSEKEVVIEAVGNRWAIPMVHHMLVHPSLRYLAASRGVLMLHAGAVAFNGRSLVLTGHGGVGKTTTVSALLAGGGAGLALHADDYVFVTPQGETFSYLTRAHLYQPLLSWVPALRQRLTREERLRLRVLGAVRRWSREGIKWPVRMAQDRLWPEVPHARQARLAAVVWLARGQGPRATLAPFAPTAQDRQGLLAMNFYEARHFAALLEAQGGGAEAEIAAWQAREGALLEQLLERVPSYRLALPHGGRDLSFLPALKRLAEV